MQAYIVEMESRFFICSCYFYKHIFLQRYRIHVDFHSQKQFTSDYGKVSPVSVRMVSQARSLGQPPPDSCQGITVHCISTSLCVTQILKERGCDENDFSVVIQDVSIYNTINITHP